MEGINATQLSFAFGNHENKNKEYACIHAPWKYVYYLHSCNEEMSNSSNVADACAELNSYSRIGWKEWLDVFFFLFKRSLFFGEEESTQLKEPRLPPRAAKEKRRLGRFPGAGSDAAVQRKEKGGK